MVVGKYSNWFNVWSTCDAICCSRWLLCRRRHALQRSRLPAIQLLSKLMWCRWEVRRKVLFLAVRNRILMTKIIGKSFPASCVCIWRLLWDLFITVLINFNLIFRFYSFLCTCHLPGFDAADPLDGSCLACYHQNGRIAIFTLPSLKPLLDVDLVSSPNVR